MANSSGTVKLDGREYFADYEYTRGRPAVMHLRNGDPGYPADPPEIDFDALYLTRNGAWKGERKVAVEKLPADFYDRLADKFFELEDERRWSGKHWDND